MKYKLSAIQLSRSLTITFKNKKRGISNTITFTDTHLNYQKAVDLLKEVIQTPLFLENQKVEEDVYEEFRELKDTTRLLATWSDGALDITSTAVTHLGKPVQPELASFLLEKFLRNPHDTTAFNAWSKFIASVNNAASNHTVERLFLFLSQNDLYISDCGQYVYAWRVCTNDYKDKYTRTFDNSVGSTCKVATNQVEADPNKACSKGLHIASIDYLKRCYAGSGDRLMIVKVPISAIVSIPYDYEGSKVRVSEFTVVAEAGVWGQTVDGNNYPDLSKYGFSSTLDS